MSDIDGLSQALLFQSAEQGMNCCVVFTCHGHHESKHIVYHSTSGAICDEDTPVPVLAMAQLIGLMSWCAKRNDSKANRALAHAIATLSDYYPEVSLSGDSH